MAGQVRIGSRDGRDDVAADHQAEEGRGASAHTARRGSGRLRT
ncbi:hypothetical protein [Streptosporangium minutum]|nr:hypothetical protein [Streptosporangium minutum]